MSFVERLLSKWDHTPVIIRIAILWALVAGIWFALVGHTLDNTPVGDYIRGGTADWLVTNEAWSGGNPFAPLNQLAEQQLGWIDTQPTEPHPRPPSALLLLGPLTLSPSEEVIRVLAVVNALALSVWVVASLVWLRLPARTEFLIIPLAVMTPGLNSAVWGAQLPVVAAFVGIGLANWRKPLSLPVGISVAAGFKLFPFLMAFAGKGRQRWKDVVVAGGAFVLLTFGGLALPGVGPGDATAAIVNAPESYSASDIDLSLNHLFDWAPGSVVFPLVGVVLIVAISRFMSDRGAIALSLIAMVLFAPYAWPEYMVLWFPALIYSWRLGPAARWPVFLLLIVTTFTKNGQLIALTGLIFGLTLALSDAANQRRTMTAQTRSLP